MAKPSLADTRFATALTNNTAPASGQRDSGWTVNQTAVSSYFNSLAKAYYDWFVWIDSGILEGVDLTLTGNLVVNGNTTLGNAPGDTVAVSGPLTVGAGAAVTGNLNVTGIITHGDWVVTGMLLYSTNIITVAGTPAFTAAWTGTVANYYLNVGTSGDCFIPIPIRLASNEKIKSLTLYFADSANSNFTTSIYVNTTIGQLQLLGTSAVGSSITSQTMTLGAAAFASFGVWARISTAAASIGPKPFAYEITLTAP